MAFKNKVSAIYNLQGFADVVVSDQNRQTGFAKVGDDFLNFAHRNGINSGKRLIEHEQIRLRHERTSNREATFFTTRALQGGVLGDVCDAESLHQCLTTLVAFGPTDIEGFHHGHDVLLNGQFAENRFFLWQIAHSESGPLIHGHAGHVVSVEIYGTAVWRNEANNHVECRCLTSSVGSEKTNNFAGTNVDVDAVYHCATIVNFYQPIGLKKHLAICNRFGNKGTLLDLLDVQFWNRGKLSLRIIDCRLRNCWSGSFCLLFFE